MTSKFREIVPPFHDQENCIHSAGIRWPDFGDRPSFAKPFAHIFRHSDTPLLLFSPGRRFPRPTPERSWSQIVNQVQDFAEQSPRYRHLGQLEGDVPDMTNNLGNDLDQLLPQPQVPGQLRPAPVSRPGLLSRQLHADAGFAKGGHDSLVHRMAFLPYLIYCSASFHEPRHLVQPWDY